MGPVHFCRVIRHGVASRWSWLKMRNKPYCRFPHVTNRNWSKMGSCHKKIALPFLEWKKAVPAWLENLLHCIVCGPFNEETGCSFTGINSSTNVLKWYVGMFSSSICKTVSKKRLHFSFFNLKCEVEILAYLCSFENNLLKVVFQSEKLSCPTYKQVYSKLSLLWMREEKTHA